MYQVIESQNGVSFMGEEPKFNTKKEAVKYARDFRNSFIHKSSPLKKINDTTLDGDPIFKAIHPAFGIEAYSRVIKINNN